MNKIKIIPLFIILILINFKSFSDEKIFIIYNLDSEIITNVDVEKESRYLLFLNNQLKNLDKYKIFNISKQSALRDKIKQIEILKFINIDKKNSLTERYIKNYYIKLGLNNKKEFENLLKENNISLAYVEKKIQIEATWNQLIYDKYKSQVNIDKEKLIKLIKNNKDNEKIYKLSEISFERDKNEGIQKKIKSINESISEIGFKNTANIYSISDTAKLGGELGWIEEEKLSKKIIGLLTKLKINEHTLPIQIGGSFLILKIDNIKYEKKMINAEEELKKRIEFETDKQLLQFSRIYFNKIKINTNINEL